MGIRVSGGSISLLGFGIKWDLTESDKKVARAVLAFMEDRRLLFGNRHDEDEGHSVASALDCRTFLTAQIPMTTPGKPLEATLKAMRASFRQFVELGGPSGSKFWQQGHGRTGYGIDPYSLALGDLRSQIGEQIARIAWRYDLEIDEELARILPPNDDNDPTWLPGFDHDERR